MKTRKKKPTQAILTRSYKYRIFPTEAQRSTLENQFSMCRHLWNWMIADRELMYEHQGESVSCYEQLMDLPSLKGKKPWYKSVHSQVLQDVPRRLDKAYGAFFSRIREKPKYKKKGQYTSITYPQFKDYPTNQSVKVPKIGEIRINLHRPIPQTATVKTLTVTKDGKDWYACFSVEMPLYIEATEPKSADDVIGLDLGCIDLFYGSDGSHATAPRLYRQAQSHLKKLQRRFAKELKRTTRWYKILRALQRAHSRVARRRRAFLYEKAHEILSRYKVVVVEDLRILNMTKRPKPKLADDGITYLPNGAKAKGGLNKSILDAGWGLFVNILTHLAEKMGKWVMKVAPHYTSQDCSDCGARVEKALSHRTHVCECGCVLNRDHNAALNIKALGLQRLGLCP